MDILDQAIDNLENNSNQNISNQTNIQQNVEESNVIDPIDFVFDQREQAENFQVKRSLQAVMKKDPNMVGEGLFLANELGLNKSFALDSNEAIQRLKERNQLERIQRLQRAKGNPILQRQLTDPAFAALAHDNIRNLAASETLWDMFTNIPEDSWQGIRKGVLSREKGMLAFKLKTRGTKFIDYENGFDLDYTPTDQDLEDIKRLKEIDEEIARYDADGVGLIEAGSYFVGQYGSSIPSAALYGIGTWGAKTAIGTGIGALSPDPFTTVGGGVVGSLVGFFTGWGAFKNKLTEDTFKVEGGHSFLELRQQGYSMEDATLRANAVGFGNAVIERVGFSFIGPIYGRALKGPVARSGLLKSPFIKAFQRKLGLEVSKNILSKKGKELTWNAVGRQFAKDYGILLATETGQEMLQEAVAITGNNLYADEGIETYSTGEIINRILTTGAETFKGMILFGLIGPGMGLNNNRIKANKAKKNTAVLEKLVALSKDDVTKKRNVNEYESYAQNAANKAGVKDFYFNADVFQQQLDNNAITDEQLDLFSPDLAKQLKDAKTEGTLGKLVKIPSGTYLAKIANTELGNSLFPHLKPGENEFSQTEYIQFEKDYPELIKQYKDLFTQKTQNLEQFLKESRSVKKQIKQQLMAIGVDKDKAGERAILVQKFAETYSKALGITPLEFLNRFQYTIKAEQDIKSFSKIFFNQNGSIKTDSQLFKNWFRKSKLTNADGTPQIMYHGTIDSFDYFDLDHPNRYDSGFAGTGVYLTPDKRLATRYARQKSVRTDATKEDRQVMSLYARLENPKIENLRKLKFEIKQGGKAASDGYRDKLIAEGHDGVILKNESGEVVEVVIFNPIAVKSVDNNGNWSDEVNNLYQQQPLQTFEQRGKQQEQGKPVSQEVFQLAKITENFDFASSKPFKTIKDFKVEIQKRILAAAKRVGVNLSDSSVETEKYLVQTLLADAQYALVENPNAIGWYNEKVTKAKALLAKVYPELLTDTASNFAFTWALATTSNGIDVNTNFQLTQEVYSYWKENGKFPVPFGQGKAGRAMTKSFKLINELIEKNGVEDVEKFMSTTHTVKEVETYTGVEIKDFGKTETVYGAAVIGPKIGNGFFANLYGNYEQLTLDRWAMRTWGRMTGTLVTDYTKQAKNKREQLKQYIKALTKEQKKEFETILGRKLTLGDLDAVAKRIETRTSIPANVKLMAAISLVDPNNDVANTITNIKGEPIKGERRISIGDEIRKAGNSLSGYLDGQKEQPKGPPERRFIEKIFGQVLPIMQQNNPDLTMADLQALMWYPEKKLYDTAKLKETVIETGYDDNAAPDYANAAASLVATMGISEAEIQSTLQEVDNDLSVQSEEQSRDTQRDVGESGTVRGVDTFQQQGSDNRNIDEATGLPINPDGTVTVYHHTDRKSAEQIKGTGELRSAGEPDVYVTTRAITDTGYGNTAVAIRVDPSRLSLDDEFPNGRRDFRLSVGTPKGSIRIKVGEYLEQQSSEGARGRFDPTTLTTILTKEADFSTFAHETAHYMLTVLENIVITDNAPQELTADFDRLLKFWGVKDLETWKGFDLNQKREYHEAFAYNFEQYLFEGKAPNMDKGMVKLFRRFSNFIKKVYTEVSTKLNELYRRETGKDLPILTNEIRNVMGRMLATDEQIVQAQEMYDLKAMFETQESSGMNDAEWAEYTAALQEAEEETLEIMTQQSMRQVRWVKNKLPKVAKELDKKIQKIRKTVEAEVTKEIKQDRKYRLETYLRRGEITNENGETTKVEGNYKISIDSIKKLTPFYDEASFKQEIKELGTNKYGMVSKKGVPVQVISDLFGFKNPQSMIDTLLELQPIEDVITERTNQRMLEEHSDLVDPRQLELQVQEAIHNESRARFVAVELNTLAKLMRPVRYQVAAARLVAQDILADKKLSEIRPSEFTRAEARALKEAEAAMKKGDTKAAIKAKRSQLLNNQLAKEAIEIQKQYAKATQGQDALFNKFFRTDKKLFEGSYKRNSELISAGRVILSSYGIGPKVADINVFTENLEKYDKALYEELKPMILDSQASKGQENITDLTYEEFDNINDLMKSLWHQSRRAEQVRLEGELLDLQPVIDTLVDRMKIMIQRSSRLSALVETPPGTTQAIDGTSVSYKFNKFILDWGAKFTRMESWTDRMDGATALNEGLGSTVLQLEGGKLGNFYNTLWFPVKSALDEYRVQQKIFTKQYSDLVASVDFNSAEIIANEFEFVSDESRAYTFGSESSGRGKIELLGAMLHTGNDSNLKKLLLGRKWGKLNEDGTLDVTSWKAFENRMQDEGILTEQDYKFLQAVWDLNEKMLPLLQKAHRDTEGYYFKTVKATPIINRFGEFRGGYVPAKGDPYMTDIDIKEELNVLKTEFRNSLPKVEKGMTKERNEKFYQPLSLHLGYMTKHIDDTLRYAYVQPVLQDTLKIVNNKEFTKQLAIINPVVKDEMIIPFLKTAATQKTYAPSGFGKEFDSLLAAGKRRTGIAIMFANIGNAFQQLTGLFPALIKVKPQYLRNGLVTYMRDREGTNQMIAEMSPFMADRQANLLFDIQDQLNELLINPSKYKKVTDWGKHHGYFLQQTFQGITDSIVWMGTYEQVHANMSKDMSDEAVRKEAIKQADANVRLTQDSLLPEDRAAYQNMNPIVQSVAQFSGYFNMIANLGFTQYKKLIRDDLGFKNKGKNTEQMVYAYLYTVILPAVFAGIIMRGLGGRLGEDEDEDGYIHDDIAKAVFGDFVSYNAGLVPIGGQLLALPINYFNNVPYDDDIVSSPSLRALETSATIIPSIIKTTSSGKGVTGKQIRDLSTMIMLFLGIPVTPAGKAFGYIRDVDRGYKEPANALDYVRGVLTGK